MDHNFHPTELSLIMIVILGLSLSILSGFVGPFVLASRTSSLVGTISHAILLGVGIAVFFNWNQFVCISVVGVLIGILIGIITIKDPKNKEMVMSAIWSVGMALGVILLYHKGYDGEEIVHVLFGDIEHLNQKDIVILCVGSLCVMGFILYHFKSLSTMNFNFEQSDILSTSARSMYLFLLGIISFTVVLMVKFVGIVLVLSLLSLPAAMALHLSKTTSQQVVYSVILAMAITFGGLKLSFLLHWPIGATITLFSGACYSLILFSKKT